ncbi:MAG: NAD-dependent epimerase/dehydratase family protein [Planctomycetota bacterium]
MKILVTGAAGFIGSHLAERLAGLGHETVGLDNFADYYPVALKRINAGDVERAGVPIRSLDLAWDGLGPVLEGAEAIFHLAAQPGISADTPFEAYLRNNLVATHRLAEAARGLKSLRAFVNVSTSSVYGAHATDSEETPPKPTSFYGVTKLGAEQLVLALSREGRLPACSLRLFSVYGERERPEKLFPRLVHSLLADEPFPLYEGSETHSRSFTYIADAIDGFVAVLDRIEACRGEILNIGSDEEFTTGEAIRIVEEILGRKARFARRTPRPGDQLRTRANIDKARRILGYRPVRTLRQGLEAEVAWYRDRIFGKVQGIYRAS